MVPAAQPTRRSVLAASLALGACQRPVSSSAQDLSSEPLKKVAPFAIGTAVQSAQFADPALSSLFTREVSQLTPEWEMKMEYILRPDGSFQFAAPDRIADFASQNGLALFGHTLIWYEETPAAFERLDQSKIPFRQAFANYIEAVVGRYRGRAVGWDVVNEPIAEDGNGLRESLWSARLGDIGYMELAFELARRADPQPVLFLNDYNLESNPAKRAAFLNLAERLLAAGAPLGGLGTQTHVAADLRRGAITACVADLGSLGLQVRISEMDVSLSEAKALFTGRSGLLSAQARLYAEAAEAMMALPAAQRFGVTFWGLRDRDSWLRREHPGDSPLLFDDQGRPKPDLAAFESRLTPRRKG